MPDFAPDSPLTRARARLAIERALREERAQRADLVARLERTQREAVEQQRALTEERDKVNAALSSEQAECLNLIAKLALQKMDIEAQSNATVESARQLNAERARSSTLETELRWSRLATQMAQEDNELLRSYWSSDRETLDTVRLNADKNVEEYTAQIGTLHQALDEAREANRQTARRNTKLAKDTWESSEEHGSKKKKLRRELSETHAQLEDQRKQTAVLTHDFNEVSKLLSSYRLENGGLQKELAEARAALGHQKAAGRKLVTAIVEAKLQGTGVSYSGPLNGGYNRSRDGLALRKQDELLASADLVRWQAINGKRQTARALDPIKSIEDQAVEAAIAARWALLLNPPKALRWRPDWAMWGFVLDDASEEYLCDLSTSATVEMTLAVPKKNDG